MRRTLTRLIQALLATTLLTTLISPAGAESGYSNASVYARVTGDEVVLGNELVERTWDRAPFLTTTIVDKRDGGRTWGGAQRDFTLRLDGVEVGSDRFTTGSVSVRRLHDGLRVSMELTGPGMSVTRTADAFPGIAGFRMKTVVQSQVPLPIGGYTLDEALVGTEVAPTMHAFRAGADWREPGWAGADLTVGDPHAGTWRDSRSGAAGANLQGPAQWLAVSEGDRSLFMVMERHDFPSSVAAYDGSVARLEVDYSRDIVGLGPLEENGHIENPGPGPARARVIRPGTPFELESSFVGFGTRDGDAEWQFHKYLVGHRLQPYDFDVTFNSNGTDANVISTGAKDDLDFATIRQIAPVAKRLGVDTFILDDGWQARSGDWQPDSPEYPEPRWDGSPTSKFRPRFPDSDFIAVGKEIAPMKLGLWMSPMHFNPSAESFKKHPEWACAPVGHALAATNTADPNSGSNDAGLGTWGIAAIPHIETRLRDAIENWGVEYFKFDFLVWLDCAGQGDLYDYHDAFVALLDRLQQDYPHVTFEIDETNDYRLFPFESVARGPSWFQNGSPNVERLLHNIWNLSPYIPAFSLGQHFLGGRAWQRYPVDTIMAASLTSHLTFFSDLRDIPLEVVDQARPWIDFYKEHRTSFTQLVYPLLGDPLATQWTALQSWDPEVGRGALLAFRQGSPTETQSIALRNVPPDRTFDLIAAPTGEMVGRVTSERLTAGIDITIPETDGARVLVIAPAGS